MTENRMLRNTYLYENRMFANKVKHVTIWGRKRKVRVTLIKSLTNVRV